MPARTLGMTYSTSCNGRTNWWCCLRLGRSNGLTFGPRLGRRGAAAFRLLALLLGITAAELQIRPGIPVLLKKRDLLELNDIEVYLGQLAARVQREG